MPISQDQVTYKLNLSDLDPNFEELGKRKKKELKGLVADSIIEDINNYLDGSKSPVSGGKFKAFKKDKSPSMLFKEGDMRSAITWKNSGEDEIEIGVFNSKEAPKAYNHNTGDTLPVRQFIPDEDQSFKRSIISKAKGIISDET